MNVIQPGIVVYIQICFIDHEERKSYGLQTFNRERSHSTGNRMVILEAGVLSPTMRIQRTSACHDHVVDSQTWKWCSEASPPLCQKEKRKKKKKWCIPSALSNHGALGDTIVVELKPCHCTNLTHCRAECVVPWLLSR
jgi:hypothetical protein